jgi:hypothetical protein
MKLKFVLLSIAVTCMAASAIAQQQPQSPSSNQPQSAADAARNTRPPKKKPAKVWDNDNLPTDAPITVLGEPRPDVPYATSDNSVAEKKTSDPAKVSTEAPTPEQNADSWKLQIAEQKKNISLLERELDVLQREYRLRVASYYADAGNSLRDPKKWAEDSRNYQQQVEQKNTELAAAREKLEDTRERARKAGVPAAFLQ